MKKNKIRKSAEVPVEEMNSEINVKIRRCRKSLASAGIGVMAFGLWTLFKSVMSIIYANGINVTVLDTELSSDTAFMRLLYVLVFTALAIDLAVRLFVGLTAMSESRGVRHRSGYLVWSVILFLLSVFSVWYEVKELFNANNMIDAITTILFELSSIAVFLDLFISAVRLHILQKKK